MEIETPQGLARARVQEAEDARALLMLGHGAGGSVDAPDLKIAARVARERGVSVALVEQPYRVAGKRSTPPPAKLDSAWLAVVEALRGDVPLIFGGRSSGARVACRTAADGGAVGVLALAFPLDAPRRTGPPQSRRDELDAVTVPTLVVQGRNDRFGVPEPAPPIREVALVDGDHGLKKDAAAIAAAIGDWLGRLLT